MMKTIFDILEAFIIRISTINHVCMILIINHALQLTMPVNILTGKYAVKQDFENFNMLSREIHRIIQLTNRRTTRL